MQAFIGDSDWEVDFIVGVIGKKVNWPFWALCVRETHEMIWWQRHGTWWSSLKTFVVGLAHSMIGFEDIEIKIVVKAAPAFSLFVIFRKFLALNWCEVKAFWPRRWMISNENTIWNGWVNGTGKSRANQHQRFESRWGEIRAAFLPNMPSPKSSMKGQSFS
jgi:hypothetical protein